MKLKTKHILLLILLLGFAIRIWPAVTFPSLVGNDPWRILEKTDYWIENSVFLEALWNPNVETAPSVNFYPPVLPLLIIFLTPLFGSTALAGQVLVSLIGAMIAIPIFLLAREWFNEKIGLLSAFLAVTGVDIVYYSASHIIAQNIGFLLFSFGLYFAYKMIKNKKHALLGFAVCATLLVISYTTYAIWLFVISSISMFLTKKEKVVDIVLAYIASGIVLLPYINKMRYATKAIQGSSRRFLELWVEPLQILTPFRVGLLTFIFAGYALIKKEKLNKWLITWVLIIAALNFIATIGARPSRYIASITLPLSIIAAVGIQRWLKDFKITKEKKQVFFAVLVLVSVVPSIAAVQFQLIGKHSITAAEYDAYNWVLENSATDDFVIHAGLQPGSKLNQHPESGRILSSENIKEEALKSGSKYIFVNKHVEELAGQKIELDLPVAYSNAENTVYLIKEETP